MSSNGRLAKQTTVYPHSGVIGSPQVVCGRLLVNFMKFIMVEFCRCFFFFLLHFTYLFFPKFPIANRHYSGRKKTKQ